MPGTIICSLARIVEVGCWAHARRKWDEALDTARLPCTDVLLRIRALYKVEDAQRHPPTRARTEELPLPGQSPGGGKACAMALTFLQSAKAVGANPYDYLHDIYNRLWAHPANRINELLPAAWMRDRASP